MQELKRDEILIIVLITEVILIIIALILSYIWNINVFHNIIINIKSTLTGIAGAACLIVCNFLVVFILPRVFKSLTIIKTAYNQISKLVINCDFSSIVLIALLSGTVEELLFRGIVQPQIGIILASILFGLLHIASKETIITGVYSIFIGLYLGCIYLYTGNLWIPIVIHILNNLIAIPVMQWHYKKYVKSVDTTV